MDADVQDIIIYAAILEFYINCLITLSQQTAITENGGNNASSLFKTDKYTVRLYVTVVAEWR